MEITYKTLFKYLNMFYGNFQYSRIIVGIGRDDSWRRIDVGFGWIMVATKNDHKPTVVWTPGANWER